MRMPEIPPSLPEGYNFGEVLRDLITIGQFRNFVEINDTQFPYWEKWKYLAKEWNYSPEKLWAAVQTMRTGNTIDLVNNYSFKLNSPTLMHELLHQFDLNLGGSMQSEGIIPSAEKDRYLLSSLMEEAIASSQLEGAVTTRRVAKEMLETNRKPKNESEQMILNNYEGMKWIVTNKDKPFSIENILELHKIITRNTLSNPLDEGAFRSSNNVNVVDVQTGEVVYHPPSILQLPELMNSFCQFANDQHQSRFFIHPIVKGITLHFLIGFIHPFADGNGRTARTLFYWYLIKKGYWLIEYMSVSRIILKSKSQYARAYLHTELDHNDLTYFVLYNLKCIKTSLEELKKHIERKTRERKESIELLRNTTFNIRQISLLQDMIHDHTNRFTVDQLEKWFTVSNQTARNDLNELVAMGLLDQRRAGKKIVYFPAEGFMDTLKKLQSK